jgi:hypothetical protein
MHCPKAIFMDFKNILKKETCVLRQVSMLPNVYEKSYKISEGNVSESMLQKYCQKFFYRKYRPFIILQISVNILLNYYNNATSVNFSTFHLALFTVSPT